MEPSATHTTPSSLKNKHSSYDVLFTKAATTATASAGDTAFSKSFPIFAVGPSAPQRITSGTPPNWIWAWCLQEAHARTAGAQVSSTYVGHGLCQHQPRKQHDASLTCGAQHLTHCMLGNSSTRSAPHVTNQCWIPAGCCPLLPLSKAK